MKKPGFIKEKLYDSVHIKKPGYIYIEITRSLPLQPGFISVWVYNPEPLKQPSPITKN